MEIIIPVAMCAVTAVFAYFKGFNPALWFLAAGCIGWIPLALLPSANKKALTTGEKARRKKLGDRVGFYISAVPFAFLVIRIGGEIASRLVLG
jgi:hypothetical protein